MSIKQAVRWAPRSSLVPTTALPLDHPKLQPPVHVVKKDERSKDPEVQRVALLPATIKSAKAKVTDAAVHYDRDRDAVVMRSFEGAASVTRYESVAGYESFAQDRGERVSDNDIEAYMQQRILMSQRAQMEAQQHALVAQKIRMLTEQRQQLKGYLKQTTLVQSAAPSRPVAQYSVEVLEL